MTAVATATTRSGDATKASAVFQQATAVALGIGDPSGKAQALARIALATAETGNRTRASAVFEQALRVADGIGYPVEKAQALARIASVAEERSDKTRDLGLIEESLPALVERALRVTEAIGDPKQKADALVAILNDTWHVAHKAKNSKLFEQALQVTEGISDTKNKSFALGAIAIFSARIGEKNRALTFLEQARQVADGIANYDVQAMAWIGAETEDKAMLDRAREAAEKIGDPQIKTDALRRFMGAKDRFEELTTRRVVLNLSHQVGDAVQTGDWRGAYEIVLSAGLDGPEEDSLIADILEAWASRQDPALANANTQAGEE